MLTPGGGGSDRIGEDEFKDQPRLINTVTDTIIPLTKV